LVLLLLTAGCAPKAGETLAKLKLGMTPQEVRQALGEPKARRCIRFTGHKSPYLVWEYSMVPERGPVCASEGAGRLITGMATLGASEIIWSHVNAKPHWVYFINGMMVYTSLAFDCRTDDTCSFADLEAADGCRQAAETTMEKHVERYEPKHK
jgi:hypothetical protein